MFDSLTVAALADQLSREVESGRVQQVGLISRRAVWFEIFANRRRTYLIASAENAASAVYLTGIEPVWDRQLVTPLLLLLRKYARGGRLVSVQQPPLERTITLTIAAPRLRAIPSTEIDPTDNSEPDIDNEDSENDAVYTHLHLEIMGRHSNLILVDDAGLIMESAKRVTPVMSRVRPISPRHPFAPPPPRISRDPRGATERDLAEIMRSAPNATDLVKLLPRAFRGMSPQVAAEAVFRAGEDRDQVTSAAAVARAIRHLFEPMITNAWTPAVYRDEDDVAVAYAAQPMRHLAARYRETPVELISRAIELCDGGSDAGGAEGRHAVRANRLAGAITYAIGRLTAKLDALDSEETRHEGREQLRQWGELIFGYLWQLKPGDQELVVDGVRVPLDPELDPKEQARQYLQQYRDGKNSDERISAVRVTTRLELDYLEQLRTLAGQSVSIQDIEDLEAEWRMRQPSPAGNREGKRSSGKKRTLPVVEVKGHPIYVGRSGSENDRVTFEIAGAEDTWLHARGVPGSHVVVRWHGVDRDDDAVLLRAAELAAFFSQSRASGRVEVDITARRFVRKIKGAGPGMVTYRNERTVSVSPVGPG